MAASTSGNFFPQLELLTQDEEEAISIAEALSKWGACPRCVLRFLGEKQPHIYRKPVKEIEAWIHHGISAEDSSNGVSINTDNNSPSDVCIACIGILQDYYSSDSFIEEIKNKTKAEGFDFHNYFCSISTPVTIIIREHALRIELRTLNKSMYYGHSTEDVTAIKDVWKWANGVKLCGKLGVPFDPRSPFEVSLNFIHPSTEKECSFLAFSEYSVAQSLRAIFMNLTHHVENLLADIRYRFDLFPNIFKQRKHNKHGWEVFTRVNVNKALGDLSEQKFKRCYQCPPRRLACRCDCDPISCAHESLFIAGRYNKYSRHLSQTPWLIEGQRKSESSIQELTCDLLEEKIKPLELKFSAAGREDVDVKMLGRGRPFVAEFVNPHFVSFTPEELAQIQKEINDASSDIKVRDLQIISREDTSFLKEGEADKIKCYSSLCWTEKCINQEEMDSILGEIKDLKLIQKTPIRVLHRRPLAGREKIIHNLSCKVIDQHHFKLLLTTQAGTYIKEFVHGDFGRTKPNMNTILGAECDILELDVEEVQLDWPKKIDPD